MRQIPERVEQTRLSVLGGVGRGARPGQPTELVVGELHGGEVGLPENTFPTPFSPMVQFVVVFHW